MSYLGATVRLFHSRGISRSLGGCKLSSLCNSAATQPVTDDADSEDHTNNSSLDGQLLQCRRRNPAYSLPSKLQNVINTKLLPDRGHMGQLAEGVTILKNQLWSRRQRLDNVEIKQKARQLQDEILLEQQLQQLSKDQLKTLMPQVKENLVKELRKRVYRWHPFEYDKFGTLCYLVGRTPMEYAALRRIFSEMHILDPSLVPTSCLDFGSGVGSVWWALKEQYPSSFGEYFSIEPSREMRDTARFLVQNGDTTKEIPASEYSQRCQLPMSSKITYDIVVSAYSLMEIPSRRERNDVIRNLWQKTNRHLVIVENGTLAGFKLVNEARSLILEEQGNRTSLLRAHVLAPCTHNLPCQRLNPDLLPYPCSFQARYMDLLNPNDGARETLYSYVILTKAQPDALFDGPPCARIIQEVLPRSKHVVCRMCTSKGDLVEKVFSKGKNNTAIEGTSTSVYKAARRSKWGELFLFEDAPSASKKTSFNKVPTPNEHFNDEDYYDDFDEDYDGDRKENHGGDHKDGSLQK